MTVGDALLEAVIDGPGYNVRSLLPLADWSSDAPDDVKAYALACISELAYLARSRFDLAINRRPSRYDVVDSHALALLIAFGGAGGFTEVLTRADFQPVLVERPGFLYLLVRLRDVLIIAVRGTQAVWDWRINLRAPVLTGRRRPALHAGFEHEAIRALPELRRAAAAFSGVTNIYLTGHSLGGAIASVLKRLWTDQRLRRPYSFGAPRFGDEAATRRAQTYAFCKPADLVPHLAPRVLGYADAEEPLRSVTEAPVPRSGLPIALSWITPRAGKPAAVEHAVEGYRRLLGLRLRAAVDFPELVYANAIRKAYGR